MINDQLLYTQFSRRKTSSYTLGVLYDQCIIFYSNTYIISTAIFGFVLGLRSPEPLKYLLRGTKLALYHRWWDVTVTGIVRLAFMAALGKSHQKAKADWLDS
jgi:hypothetical protein